MSLFDVKKATVAVFMQMFGATAKMQVSGPSASCIWADGRELHTHLSSLLHAPTKSKKARSLHA